MHSTTAHTTTPRVRLRSVALPTEHGGWGFLLEPLLLGLLVAPSLAGLFIAVGMTGAFLLRHPLKLVGSDHRRGKRYARTRRAKQFALLYGIAAGLSFLIAASMAGLRPLLPLIAAAPLALTALLYDLRGNSRTLVAELAGPVAMGSSSAVIALIGGWAPVYALTLWAIIAARAVPSILYVRARLRLEREEVISPAPALLSHGIALLAVGALTAAGTAPLLAAVGMALLLLRGAYGLSRLRKSVPAKIVGFQEIGYGLLIVLLTALGYAISG